MAVIRAIEAIPVDLPLLRPINLGGRLQVDRAETVLVRIETSDGQVGWGECAPAPNLTGETREQMLGAITERLAPALLHQDRTDYRRLEAIMLAEAPMARGARAAVDCALVDLTGRSAMLPSFELFNIQWRDLQVDVMWMIGTPSIDEDAGEAAKQRKAGYRIFKLKVGSRSLEDDLKATARVREAIGSDAILYADANGTMDEARAIAYGKRAAEFRVGYLEQPLLAADIDGMVRVARAIPMPVCVDEGIHNIEDIDRFHRRRAGSGAALRAVKLGGFSAVDDACRRCATLGWKVNLPGKIAETSLATGALLNNAMASDNLDWAITPTNHYLAEDIVYEPLKVENGTMTLPYRPGLGVDVDPLRVKEFRRR